MEQTTLEYLEAADLDKGCLASAWRHLNKEQSAALSGADDLVARVALQTAAAVAATLRREDLASRPVCARKAEKDVLEQAARELQLLVVHTAGAPYAMDGQIALGIQAGGGLIGIEVKSYAQSVPSDEVDKFRSDLSLGPFVVGIFLSLRSPIAKTPRGLHVQNELSLKGAVPAIYVSGSAGEPVSQHIVRSALSLACFFSKQRQDPLSLAHGRPAERVLESVHAAVQAEVAALGIARKRLREDEDAFQKRVDSATDSIVGVQQRLVQLVSNLVTTE